MFIRRTFNQLGFLNSGINRAMLLFFAVIVLMNTFDNNAGAQYDPCSRNPGSFECACYKDPNGERCSEFCSQDTLRIQAECRDSCVAYPDSPGCSDYCTLNPDSTVCKCRNPQSKSCADHCMVYGWKPECTAHCAIDPSNCICKHVEKKECQDYCTENPTSPRCKRFCEENPSDCGCFRGEWGERSNPNCSEFFGPKPDPDPEPEPTPQPSPRR